MAGYSTTPLYKKLGMKTDFHIKIINPPANYNELISADTIQVVFKNKATADLDFIHVFTNSRQELESMLPLLKQQIKKDGMIWVSWCKKSAAMPTEVTENMVRDMALATGLVDVKICAVDESWSGLKLVFRLKDR